MPAVPLSPSKISPTRRRLFCGVAVLLSLTLACLLLEVGSRIYLSRVEPEPLNQPPTARR